MKILQVIPYFTPKRGGDVNVCYFISKNLADIGHDVTIITTDFEFDINYSNELKHFGVHILTFKCDFNNFLFLYSHTMNGWLQSNIRSFDIIHLHDFRTYQNLIVSKKAIKSNIPYIIQAHGDLPPIGKTRLKFLYDIVWGNKILKNAAQVIALTQTEKDQYISMGVNEIKTNIIPNAIEPEKYLRLIAKEEFSNALGIPLNFKIILYLGRIHKTKGIDLLIESFIEAKKTLQMVKLVIIGNDDGFKETILENLKRKNLAHDIFIIDFVNDDDKIKAFYGADIFVTPRFYGFPITFLEACACGVPVVTTNNGDKLDWIDDNVGLVADYNKNSLSEKIQRILSDDNLKKKYGENGRKIIFDQFNWSKIVLMIESVYEKARN